MSFTSLAGISDLFADFRGIFYIRLADDTEVAFPVLVEAALLDFDLWLHTTPRLPGLQPGDYEGIGRAALSWESFAQTTTPSEEPR